MSGSHQASVGRDEITGLQHHQVTRDDVGGGNLGLPAVPHHPGVECCHLLQAGQCLLCPALLRVPDGGVEDDDGQDHKRIDPVAEDDARDEGRHQEHPDEDIGELAQEQTETGRPFLRLQDVRTTFGETASRLLGGQPGGRVGAQPLTDLGGAQGVPRGVRLRGHDDDRL